MLRKLLSLPKTVYFNFRCFPLSIAITLPVFVSYDVKLKNLRRNCVVFENNSRTGSLRVGFSGGSFEMGHRKKGYLNFNEHGTIFIKNKAIIPAGSIINVCGKLSLGNNFASNAGLIISCETEISFGDNIAVGWEVTVIDGDGHDILILGQKSNHPEKIIIGNHVWLCAKCTLMKGTQIQNDSIVGYGSIVSKKFSESRVIIAGIPAKIVSYDADWRK